MEEEDLSLLDNRSELRPKVMAVEPFFPQHISTAINIVSAHIKGEAYCIQFRCLCSLQFGVVSFAIIRHRTNMLLFEKMVVMKM